MQVSSLRDISGEYDFQRAQVNYVSGGTLTLEAPNDATGEMSITPGGSISQSITLTSTGQGLSFNGDVSLATENGEQVLQISSPSLGTYNLDFTFERAENRLTTVLEPTDVVGINYEETDVWTRTQAYNSAPLAEDDSFSISANAPAELQVTANDSDPDGDSLQVVDTTSALNGTVTVVDNEVIQYTPNPGFSGIEEFSYTIRDSKGASDTAAVSVRVKSEDDTLPISTVFERVDLSGRDNFVGTDAPEVGILEGSRREFQINKEDGFLTVSGPNNIELQNIERLEFDDGVVAFDDTAERAYRLYEAAFDRQPDAQGLGYWIDQLDQGADFNQVARSFVSSEEFRSLYGTSPSDDAFVDLIYQNVLDRQPDQSGESYWTGELAQGMPRAEMLARFSDSEENRANVEGQVDDGVFYL